jgi:hypothetical protein
MLNFKIEIDICDICCQPRKVMLIENHEGYYVKKDELCICQDCFNKKMNEAKTEKMEVVING